MTNYDEKTGIRYGVISPHSISGDCMYDLYEGPNSTDPWYESGIEEIKNQHSGEPEESIEEYIQEFSDHYENPDGSMDYSDNEYTLHVSGDNFGIFVMKSPYYTYCRGCSPCAPGAGDLDSPVDISQKDEITGNYWLSSNGKTLCLGPEWFDKSDDQYARKIPYRYFGYLMTLKYYRRNES